VRYRTDSGGHDAQPAPVLNCRAVWWCCTLSLIAAPRNVVTMF
jgi:hypothetical protein